MTLVISFSGVSFPFCNLMPEPVSYVDTTTPGTQHGASASRDNSCAQDLDLFRVERFITYEYIFICFI